MEERDRELRAKELFDILKDVPPSEHRSRLEELEPDESGLREYVLRLLEADLQPDLLDEGVLEPGRPLSSEDGLPEEPTYPEAIGPYKILGIVGRGGMGIVYRAEQPSPRRLVALKVLRPGLADTRGPRYFESEAQALGRLKDPGIAQIYEAGTADFGHGPVPYLVMELIEGTDLVDYGNRHALSVRDRVLLLENICRSVHSAHLQGVIHRDLKPANIRVSLTGATKVLDFGLARLLDEEGKLTTETSSPLRILGTVPYMSPEHLDPEKGSVDVRSDVYSLGATAYELLSGHPPFDVGQMPMAAALHRVSHGVPVPLNRKHPEVPRDLAAVVDMAIDRSKEQRYQSAEALADDFRRWLDREPVLARRASAWEVASKFAARHRTLVGGTFVLFLVLLSGLATTLWQAREARAESVRAERFSSFLQDRLRSAADPRDDGVERPITYMLDRAAAEMESFFADDELAMAQISDTLGMAYYENSRYDEAFELVARSVEIRQRLLGERSPDTLSSRANLGLVLTAKNRSDEAEEHLRQAYEGLREVRGLEHPDTQRAAERLAMLLLQRDGPAEAEAILLESYEAKRAAFGEKALPTLATLVHLASAWKLRGEFGRAEEALREAIDGYRAAGGAEEFGLYEALNTLGTLLLVTGEFQEAEDSLVEALEGYRRMRGVEHQDTEVVDRNLETVRSQRLGSAGEGTTPEEEGDEVPEGEEGMKAINYVFLVMPATAKFYDGRIEEAEHDLRRAVSGLKRLGGHERSLLKAQQCLASVLSARGLHEESQALQLDILHAHEETGTERNPEALYARATSADALRRLGRSEEALEEARAAYEELVEVVGPTGLYALSARTIVSGALADLDQLDASLEHAAAAVETACETLGEENRFTYMFRVRHGRTLTLLGRFDEARSQLQTAYDGLIGLHSERSPYVKTSVEALVKLYEAWDRPEELAAWGGKLREMEGPPETGAPGEASASSE